MNQTNDLRQCDQNAYRAKNGHDKTKCFNKKNNHNVINNMCFRARTEWKKSTGKVIFYKMLATVFIGHIQDLLVVVVVHRRHRRCKEMIRHFNNCCRLLWTVAVTCLFTPSSSLFFNCWIYIYNEKGRTEDRGAKNEREKWNIMIPSMIPGTRYTYDTLPIDELLVLLPREVPIISVNIGAGTRGIRKSRNLVYFL